MSETCEADGRANAQFVWYTARWMWSSNIPTDDERAEQMLVPGKESVVRRQGSTWGFTLPEQHTIEVDESNGNVAISTPGEGSDFRLDRIEETDDEVIVYLGDELGRHGPAAVVGEGEPLPPARGYPFPEIQDEIQRLRSRWIQAGGAGADFDAWAQGDDWETYLRRMRRELREVDAT